MEFCNLLIVVSELVCTIGVINLMVSISCKSICFKDKILCSIFLYIMLIFTQNFEYDVIRIIINYVTVSMMFKVKMKCNMLESIILSIVIFIILMLIDMIIFFTMSLGFNEVINKIIVKGVSNFIVGIFALSVSKNKYFSLKINRSCKILCNRSNMKIILISILQMVINMTIIYVFYFYSKDSIVIGLYICLSLIILNVIFLYQFMLKKKYHERAILFESDISEKDERIDELLRNRHIISNLLIVLRSMLDDNSEAARYIERTIGSIEPENKSLDILGNISDKSLQYLIRYKLTKALECGINVNAYADKSMCNYIKSHGIEFADDIYTVVGILFDNAIEASSASDHGSISVNISDNDGSLMITIVNTFKQKPDMSKLYEKGYSTKGYARGRGLSIVQGISNKRSPYLKIRIYIKNGLFISKIKIKSREHKIYEAPTS